jgi:hypothetical protein
MNTGTKNNLLLPPCTIAVSLSLSVTFRLGVPVETPTKNPTTKYPLFVFWDLTLCRLVDADPSGRAV